jgi:Protein of unknown function (DUF1559)
VSTAFSLLLLLTLGQAQEPTAGAARAKAIAPFVDSDVFAVIQVEIKKLDVPRLSARMLGGEPHGMLADGQRVLSEWSERLKAAGARELYLVFSVIDMPGPPLLVVPLRQGADAEGIARTIHAPPAPIHDAIVAGPPQALARVAQREARPRIELSAAFQAVGDESVVIRALLLPSDDIRRVLEELHPRLPDELGGGPMTDLTHGLLWAAAAIDDTENSALKLVAGSRDAASARSLVQLAENVLGFLRRSPEVEGSVPGLAKSLAGLSPAAAGDRVTLALGAREAAALLAVVMAPVDAAAAREACTNNGKQIMLALHEYHDLHNNFPPAFSTSKDGKPLLSWRVLVLPFLEQKKLYDEFHLDEPWDSPHNRTLIPRMPEVFRCPAERPTLAAAGKTRYLAPRGPNTVLRGAEPVSMRDITDGTSNTIMVIDAGDDHAAIWTKPEDWEFDPEPGIESIFRSHRPGGIIAMFADGSVRYLRQRIKPAILRPEDL